MKAFGGTEAQSPSLLILALKMTGQILIQAVSLPGTEVQESIEMKGGIGPRVCMSTFDWRRFFYTSWELDHVSLVFHPRAENSELPSKAFSPLFLLEHCCLVSCQQITAHSKVTVSSCVARSHVYSPLSLYHLPSARSFFLKMEEADFSEVLVPTYQIARRMKTAILKFTAINSHNLQAS